MDVRTAPRTEPILHEPQGRGGIFFVIGAGMLGVLLILVAEAWRFVAVERNK